MRATIPLPLRWSFRTVVLGGTLSVVVAVMLLLAGLLNYYNRKQVQQLADALLAQKLAHVEGRVDELLRGAERQGQICAQVSPDGLAPERFLEVFAQVAPSFAQQTDFTYLGYGCETTGEYAMLERFTAKEFRLRTYLRLPGGERVIRDYRLDRNRFVLERTSPWSDYDPRQRPFYQAARLAGQPVWTASYTFPGNDRRAAARGVSHAVPVYDEHGALQGVWDVDLDTLSLSAFLKAQADGVGPALVVERDTGGGWNLIAHPRLMDHDAATLLASGNPHSDPVSAALLAAVSNGQGTPEHLSFRFSAQGQRYLAAWSFLQDEHLPRWLLAVSLPESLVQSSLAVNRRSIVLLVLGATLACVALALVLSRLIARPVEQLRNAVEGFTAGGPVQSVPTSGPVEISRLARAFNAMASAVGQRERELRTANERLEAEVRGRALREAELEAIFANAPVELWAVNDSGRYTMQSGSLRERCGDLKGRTPLESALPRELAEAYEANNRRALAGETVRGETTEIFNGQPRHFNWIVAPIRMNGVVTSALGVSLDVTDRRRAEDALLQSQQRLKLHLENTPLAVIDWSGNFTVLSWNPAAEAIFGWPAAEALGRHGLFLLPESTHSDTLRGWNDLLRKRGGHRDYIRNVTRDGRLIDCEWYDTVITDENQQVLGVSSLVLDVTQRIGAERMFQESEQRFATAFRDSPVPKIVARHADGRIIDANESFLSLLGLRRDEVVGCTTESLGLWDSSEDREEFLRRGGPEGLVRNVDRHLRRVHGGEIDVLLSTATVTVGNELCLLATLVDHTVRKAAERELRDQQTFLTSLISHLPGMVYRCRNDRDATLVYLSDGASELTGYSASELVEGSPRTLWSLLHPDDRAHRQKVIAEAFGVGERSYSHEYRIVHRSGEVRWVWERGEGVPRADGAIESMIGFITDITVRKESEEEVLKLNLTLERRVQDRTVELASANEKLKELDRLKSQFLATMSHELRTPLNSIIGFSTLLGQGIAGPLNPEQHKQIELVRSSARHLLGLINDLLDLSRIESDRVELYLEDFPVAEVLREVEDTLAPMVAQKRLTFSIEPGPPVVLHTDRKRVYQVVLNLANNAVKFTEHGRVSIRCAPEGDGVRIDVEDTGIGIRADQLPMLFEAFRQLDGSARRVYEGTGLGLHLCRKLLGLLGGSVGVESTYGQGSRFTVLLPRTPPPSSPLRT